MQYVGLGNETVIDACFGSNQNCSIAVPLTANPGHGYQ